MVEVTQIRNGYLQVIHAGLTDVDLNNGSSFIDKIEKIAFSSRWYSCAPFSEGMAMVSNGSNDFFIKLIRTEKEYFCFEYNNRYVLQI